MIRSGNRPIPGDDGHLLVGVIKYQECFLTVVSFLVIVRLTGEHLGAPLT